MYELTLIAILVVLILIFLLLRTWVPILQKISNFIIDNNDQFIEAVITIRNNKTFREEFELTTIGLHKKFEVSTLTEVIPISSKEDDSTFYRGELVISTYENIEEMVSNDKGYILNINLFKDSTKSYRDSSRSTLVCTSKEYEFLKDKLQNNQFIALMTENGRINPSQGLESIKIKARKVSIHLEESYGSTNSIRRLIKRFSDKSDLFKNSELKYWYEENKDKFTVL